MSPKKFLVMRVKISKNEEIKLEVKLPLETFLRKNNKCSSRESHSNILGRESAVKIFAVVLAAINKVASALSTFINHSKSLTMKDQLNIFLSHNDKLKRFYIFSKITLS